MRLVGSTTISHPIGGLHSVPSPIGQQQESSNLAKRIEGIRRYIGDSNNQEKCLFIRASTYSSLTLPTISPVGVSKTMVCMKPRRQRKQQLSSSDLQLVGSQFQKQQQQTCQEGMQVPQRKLRRIRTTSTPLGPTTWRQKERMLLQHCLEHIPDSNTNTDTWSNGR